MVTIRINFRALMRPVCWMLGHGWEDYTVIHPAWNREGRHCIFCGLEQLVTYHHEFTDDGESITVRTNWNGTERYKYVQTGTGKVHDPFQLRKVSIDEGSVSQEDE